MKIYVESLRFQCIIGILDFEREKEQDVIINLELEYDFEDQFINYADLAEMVKQTMINENFLLIEDAILKISTDLKKEFSQINSLKLKITKPSILPDCQVSVEEYFKFNT